MAESHAPAGGLFSALKKRLQNQLASEIDPALLTQSTPEAARALLQEKIQEILDAEPGMGGDSELVPRLGDEFYASIVGYGPIQSLLEDDTVSEVMVNAPDKVYVERAGRLEKTAVTFQNDQEVLRVIEKIVAPLGRRIDESSPLVDGRLPDGSRVNAIIRPLALRGPSLTIRKFPKHALGMGDLVQKGSLTPGMATVLDGAVRGRLNILVSGGTGSGKTTTLNALSSFIPEGERIVTIEDAAELRIQQEHVVSLESRPPNLEGRGEIGIRHLVRNALRMRPDRIIVGEVRGGEALDMLQAMNTGHDGSLTTLHANSPRDAISRLETLVLMAGMDLPVQAIREQIASAVHVIVQQQRLRDGTRRITHITEVLDLEGGEVKLQDVFLYRLHGLGEDGRMRGAFEWTGLRPAFLQQLGDGGIVLPDDVFAGPL